MHDVSISDAELDCFVHGLVSSIEGRFILLQENKSQIRPSFRVGWIHVVDEGEDTLRFIVLSKVVASDTKVEMREGCLVILCAHEEHDLGIFPLLELNIEMASSLEYELVLNLLLGQIGDPDSFKIGGQSSLMISLLVVSVANLDIALKPGILQFEHLLKGGNRRLNIADLDADFRDTS